MAYRRCADNVLLIRGVSHHLLSLILLFQNRNFDIIIIIVFLAKKKPIYTSVVNYSVFEFGILTFRNKSSYRKRSKLMKTPLWNAPN